MCLFNDPVTSGPPEHDARLPDAVRTLIAGRDFDAVWENELGGLTFAVESDAGDREFITWTPTSAGIDLAREIVRLRWARLWLAVPRVLGHGQDAEGAWLITAAVPGESAVSPRWTSDPKTAVTAIGSGLRLLHDALPVRQCPFTWSTESRIATARRRAAQGDIDPANWDDAHKYLTVSEALDLVDAAPSIDRLVVCHGDACAPNTLLTADGAFSGHVDLGSLGVADRWADLAIATWSTTWNYGPGWEQPLLAAYGVDPDPERSAYYRLLWDLDP